MTLQTAGGDSARGSWGSRLGFILAAAGSAVGLGNVWKFPYVTGQNGGGFFVVLYLLCVAVVGLPILIAEVLLGRATQRSPVVAFQRLTSSHHPWVGVGWLGVAAGFVILSFYSVVAGWVVYYCGLALTDAFSGLPAKQIEAMFGALVGNPWTAVSCHGAFMVMTIGVVIGGVKAGIERWSRILMPALLLMLVGLAAYGATLPGFGEAMSFVFGAHADKLSGVGVLEAMGQAFFSLSLGMGAMLTYGSYLSKEMGLLKASAWVALLDTGIALLSALVIFPITATYGMAPQAGPGLVFKSIPVAFSQMPGGTALAIVFFLLLLFAALTSAVSLLEVVASSFIDLFGWRRWTTTMSMGAVIFFVGVPSALWGWFFDWAD